MQKLDIKLSWYYDPSDTTILHTLFECADVHYRPYAGHWNDTITIGTPGDHDNNIYTDLQDYINTVYPSDATSILSTVNTNFGDFFELGDLVYVDQDIDDEIQTKQDHHINLDALSSMTLAAGKMLYAAGTSTFGIFDTTSYGRGLLNTANQAALQTAAGMVAPDWNASIGFSAIANKPSIPSTFDNLTDGATNKSYTATEKTKLSGIASDATANSSDATLLARTNHTGSQAISTITGLQTALDGKYATPTPGAHVADAATNAPTDADTSVNILALGAALNDSNTKQNAIATNLNSVATKLNTVFDRLEALGLLAAS